MEIDAQEFIKVAWDAASAAGAFIRDHWQRPKEIAYKGAIDLVTSVDRESERIIVDIAAAGLPRPFDPRGRRNRPTKIAESVFMVG